MERAMSTDVVMDIVLSHLTVGDLLNCRKVSKFWNKAASSVLRKRKTMITKISTEITLMELGKCMKKNPDFPFAGLSFAEPWKMNSAGAMKFFKNYGERFTSLSLDTCSTIRLLGLAPFITHLPRLSILELGYPGSRLPCESLDSTAGLEDDRILNLLPSLRTLRIYCEMNQDFLLQVFQAASSPALRIECPNATYEILRALKSVGKLQTISVLHVYDGIENSLRVEALLSTESPMLTELVMDAGGYISLRLNTLMKLLISSQRTLKYLSLIGIYPSHFSSECPVLAKLTTLNLCIPHPHQSDKYIFEGVQGHKFPALKVLRISIMEHRSDRIMVNLNGKFSDDLFVVPSLTRIDLGSCFEKDEIEALARSFPQVSEIRLNWDMYKWYRLSGHRDPTNIWSVGAFKFLEKLVIWNCHVQAPTEYHDKFRMMNMDSFFTGIPISICENLRKKNQQNLIDSPFNEILRDSPNILHLKNLKELIVCVKLESPMRNLPEEVPFISMVSLWYALEMMPNLEARFVYKHDSPSCRLEEQNRHEAVELLKAAFKHVHPHVQLEPFFY